MKKIIFVAILVLFIIPVIAQVVIIPKSDIIEMHNGKSYYVHTVRKGQTIYSIAKAYDVTPDEIYFENPGSNSGINVSRQLLIPTVNKETELKNDVTATNYDFFYHVASKDETFKHISSIYLIPLKYIIKANPNLHSPLREGEYVKVPVKEAFDILDGKRSSNTNTSYAVSKNKKPKQTQKTTSGTQVHKSKTKNQKQNFKKAKKQTSKPSIVSFNPDIPVIQDYRHVVIAGETTKSIAKKYNIPVEMLKAANPGLGNSVTKGDRLRIPDKTKIDTSLKNQNEHVAKSGIQKTANKQEETSPAKNYETIKHKVKKKETLYSIGREYGVTVSELKKANVGLTTSISPGQIILVPKKKISKPYIIYNVEKNTRTNKIAKLYKIPVYQIKDFNPDIGKRLYKNDKVRIPVGAHAIIVPLLPDNENTKIAVEPTTVQDSVTRYSNCRYLPIKDQIFKVALMVPLSLEEADSLDKKQFLLTPQKNFLPFRFIEFYEGALVAFDSLTKQGMQVEMFVYDVDKNLTKTAKILNRSELREMDLIIGPFYNNSFNQVALFAGNFNIPIVNPLSYRESIVNNYSTVIKAIPNTSSQKEIIENFINKFAKNSKVFLISQTSYLDADKVIEINNGITSALMPQTKISNKDLLNLAYSVALCDTLYDPTTTPPPYLFEGTNIYPEMLENNISDSTLINNSLIKINYSTDSLHPFLENASPLRNNLVILYGTKKSFILDVLNRLNKIRDTFDIQLIGMPTWERIRNLNNVKMNNLKLSYFSSRYIDYKKTNTQNFIYKFRERFNIDPNEYAYSGFDLTYYFLSSLFNLGSNFTDCIDLFPMELLQTKYHFSRVSNTNNFANDYWNMLKLNNMSISKIPDNIILQKQ